MLRMDAVRLGWTEGLPLVQGRQELSSRFDPEREIALRLRGVSNQQGPDMAYRWLILLPDIEAQKWAFAPVYFARNKRWTAPTMEG